MSTPTHALDGERPATVTHWCETWRAMRETRVPALVTQDGRRLRIDELP